MLLNHRVNIEQRTTAEDELGQPVESWSLVAAVWANVRHLSGAQSIKSDADVSVVKASVRIRYRAGIDAGMRVTFEGSMYDIKAVMPNRREGYCDLVCERVL